MKMVTITTMLMKMTMLNIEKLSVTKKNDDDDDDDIDRCRTFCDKEKLTYFF